MRTKKLNEVFGNVFEFGIFHYISQYDVPWSMGSEWLDLEYHGNHSGKKSISPLVEALLTSAALTETDKETLAGIIWNKYHEKWERIHNVLTMNYNPLENYNMVEHETSSSEGHQSASSSGTSHTESADETDNKTTNSAYGFNSVTAVKTDESESKTTSDIDSTNTSSGSSSSSNDDSGERELTRSGNIGITTSQMMAESEIQLRKNNFYDMVFTDVDTILTSGVYCL